MSEPICKNCAHYRPHWFFFWEGDFAKCAVASRDRVSGDMQHAFIARRHGKPCGPSGAQWKTATGDEAQQGEGE